VFDVLAGHADIFGDLLNLIAPVYLPLVRRRRPFRFLTWSLLRSFVPERLIQAVPLGRRASRWSIATRSGGAAACKSNGSENAGKQFRHNISAINNHISPDISRFFRHE
jgi:hypothetical protein